MYGIKKRTVLLFAPYSFVFTAHSSLQKRAMDTKKSVCIVTRIAHKM